MFQCRSDSVRKHLVLVAIISSVLIPGGSPGSPAAIGTDDPGRQVPLRMWGSQGTAEGEFKKPGVIALDSSGNVYVSDNLNYRIQKFDRNGNFLRMWGWGVSNETDDSRPRLEPINGVL